MRIVVLKGGTSSERDVSLVSGEAVGEALFNLGYEVMELDTALPIEQIHQDLVPPVVTDDNEKLLKANLVKLLLSDEVQASDVIFLVLHGGEGEDGTVQGLLEMVGIPYTGTGVRGSAVAMDKHLSKLLFRDHNIQTPEWFLFSSTDDEEKLHNHIIDSFGYPVIIKPRSEGSTIGLSLVESRNDVQKALKKAGLYSSHLLVEKYIEGREITVAILGDEPLPVVEIKPGHKIYDYECKYRPGMSEYFAPAEMDEQLSRKIMNLAVEAYNVLGCRHFARVDLRLSDDGQPFVLEVNTIPGMTGTSLVPKAAKAAGLSFGELLEKIIGYARENSR